MKIVCNDPHNLKDEKADIRVTTIDTRRRDGLNLPENAHFISSLFFHQLERMIIAVAQFLCNQIAPILMMELHKKADEVKFSAAHPKYF